MKNPIVSNLTQERLKQLIHYNHLTGVMTWLNNKEVAPAVRGKVVTNKTNHGYGRIGIDKHVYLQHRIAWLYHYGEWPKQVVDHIDGNKQNNMISNLRDIDFKSNVRNQRLNKNNKLGLMGVVARGKKFAANIYVDRKPIYLGLFETAQDARQAYLAAKAKFHPNCLVA